MSLLKRIGVLIAVLAATLTAVSGVAQAGTYTVYGCRTPQGQAAPLGQAGWNDFLDLSSHNSYNYWSDSSCPNGPSYMWMAASRTHHNGEFAEEDFFAPANTSIQSYTLQRAVRLIPSGGYYYQAYDESDGQWHFVNGCSSPVGCLSIGDYQKESAPSNRFSHTAEPGTTRIALKLLCSNSKGCPVEPGGGSASVWLWQAAITLSDNQGPTLDGTPTGPLANSGATVSGTVPVSLTASDAGSGVYQAMISVDGHVVQSQVLDSNGGLCQQPYISPTPCKQTASGTINFDTGQVPDGTHAVSIMVSDAAGNVTTWGPVTITTVNNPCSPLPRASGMTVRAGFAVSRRVRVHRARGGRRVVTRVSLRRQLTTGYSRTPKISGRLLNAAGAPVAGEAVCIAAREDYGGAPLRPVTTLATNAHGSFTYRVHKGPSRTFYVIHRVPGGAVSASVNDHVRVPVKVHVARRHLANGQVMSWTGRLPGPRPRGLLALMQVWRGTYWETFQQIPVASNGRWAGRYRFEFTTGAQTYTFRLVVPSQTGYPYAAGVSSRIHIMVNG